MRFATFHTSFFAAAILCGSFQLPAQTLTCQQELAQLGTFTFYGDMVRVDQFEPLPTTESQVTGTCGVSAPIFPPLPQGFDFANDVAFFAKVSNLTSIGSLATFSGPSALVQLRNGNYGLVQDLVVTWNDPTPQDFSNVIFVFDIFQNSASALPQLVPSLDTEGDFDDVQFVLGTPGPYTGMPVALGFVEEDVPLNNVSDSFSECPLRAWSFAPLGTLNQGESGTVKIAFDLGVPAECTFAGTNVVSTPIDQTTMTEPVTLTFDTVTQQGQTSLTTSSQGPPPPSGFKVSSNPPTYYDISTTAVWTGNVQVCIDYSSLNVNNESNLKLFHTSDGGVTWDPITTSLDQVSDIICGTTTSFSIFAIFVPDTDNDGLEDADEVALGTDPNDPDTDDDGLLDGTEVDIAVAGCPSPLLFDSDGDLISDGDEVNGNPSTDPCNPDTDGDGICDAIDSSPTVPSASSSATEDGARMLADLVDSFDPGLFSGPNAQANSGRRNSMSSRIRNAANSISRGKTNSAVALLNSVLAQVDGQPNNWMVASAERDALAACLVSLITVLGG